MYNVVFQYLKKDLDKATIEDIERIIDKIKSREDYSPWTVQSYKAIIKKFYRWLKLIRTNKNSHRIKKTHYPEIVDWITTTMKKKNKPKIKPQDLLTEEEVSKMVQTASSHGRKH